MAFATSNLVARSTGSTRTMTGSWSAAVGDSPGTIAIGAANVIAFDFDPGVSTGPTEKPLVTQSVSGAITTLTINHKQTVTAGRFRIEY